MPKQSESLKNLLSQAAQFFNQGSYQQSQSKLQAALKIDVKNTVVLSNLGSVLHMRKEYSQALEYFEQALKINPSLVSALIGYGYSLDALGHHDKAIFSFENQLQLIENFHKYIMGWAVHFFLWDIMLKR